MSSHAMLSGITRVPELTLDGTEATTLAQAISTVNSFYNVAVAEKTLAWINLAMVAGTVYGTRLMAIRIRRGVERSMRPERAPTAPQTAVVEPGSYDPTKPVSTVEAYDGIPTDYMPGGFGQPIDPTM